MEFMAISYPASQRELIQAARGDMTQVEFARLAGVGRSALNKYEKEALGAPTKLLNYCLNKIARQMEASAPFSSRATKALAHARQAVDELEALTKNGDPGNTT